NLGIGRPPRHKQKQQLAMTTRAAPTGTCSGESICGEGLFWDARDIVDGEFAIFVFLLIWLDTAVGMGVFGGIKFPNASRETNGRLESTGKRKGDCRAWARTQAWTLCASTSFSYLLLCLR